MSLLKELQLFPVDSGYKHCAPSGAKKIKPTPWCVPWTERRSWD